MSLFTRSRVRASGLLSLLVLVGLVLAACGGAATPAPTAAPTEVAQAPTELPAPTEPPATATTAPVATAEPTATLAPTQTPEPTPTEAPTEAPTAAAPADATNCVTCHTSEETLQQLAKEQEAGESLSEGEG
jgi:outer membrane biosynthesis protein TonB